MPAAVYLVLLPAGEGQGIKRRHKAWVLLSPRPRKHGQPGQQPGCWAHGHPRHYSSLCSLSRSIAAACASAVPAAGLLWATALPCLATRCRHSLTQPYKHMHQRCAPNPAAEAYLQQQVGQSPTTQPQKQGEQIFTMCTGDKARSNGLKLPGGRFRQETGNASLQQRQLCLEVMNHLSGAIGQGLRRAAPPPWPGRPASHGPTCPASPTRLEALQGSTEHRGPQFPLGQEPRPLCAWQHTQYCKGDESVQEKLLFCRGGEARSRAAGAPAAASR